MIGRLWNLICSKHFMAIVAISGLALAYYQTFIYEKVKALTITQGLLTRVFDLHQPVGGLEISYEGENLRTAKKILWTTTFTIANSGETEIRLVDYDPREPVGVVVKGGTIVDTPKFLASNNYLQRNLSYSVTKEKLTFSPVIFEPTDSVTVSLLILGPENTKPQLESLGVVAGVGNLPIIKQIESESNKDKNKASPATSALGFILLTLGFVVIGSTAKKLWRMNERRIRTRKLNTFKLHEDMTKEIRCLVGLYQEHGKEALAAVYRIIEDAKASQKLAEHIHVIKDDQVKEQIMRQRPRPFAKYRRKLIEKGLLDQEHYVDVVSVELEKALQELVRFLEIREAELEALSASRIIAARVIFEPHIYESIERSNIQIRDIDS